MALAKLFEDFGRAPSDADALASREPDELEDEKLKSFEAGYGAGWEDAIAARNDAIQKMDDALQKSILEMRVIKENVVEDYVLGMRTVLQQIVDKVLPEIADQSLSGHVLSILEKAVSDQGDLPIEIHVSSDQKHSVALAISEYLSDGARIAADPELSSRQAVITLGPTEKMIDLDGVISEVHRAFEHFHESIQQGG